MEAQDSEFPHCFLCHFWHIFFLYTSSLLLILLAMRAHTGTVASETSTEVHPGYACKGLWKCLWCRSYWLLGLGLSMLLLSQSQVSVWNRWDFLPPRKIMRMTILGDILPLNSPLLPPTGSSNYHDYSPFLLLSIFTSVLSLQHSPHWPHSCIYPLSSHCPHMWGLTLSSCCSLQLLVAYYPHPHYLLSILTVFIVLTVVVLAMLFVIVLVNFLLTAHCCVLWSSSSLSSSSPTTSSLRTLSPHSSLLTVCLQSSPPSHCPHPCTF